MQECRTRLFGRRGASLNSHGRFGRHLVFRDTSGGHVPTLLVVARVWYLYGWSCTRSSICLLLLLLFTYACMSTSCASDGRGGGVALIGIPKVDLAPSLCIIIGIPKVDLASMVWRDPPSLCIIMAARSRRSNLIMAEHRQKYKTQVYMYKCHECLGLHKGFDLSWGVWCLTI